MSASEVCLGAQPLRIAFLVEGMSSSGVDTSTQLLAKALRALGHTVVVFVPWKERVTDENDATTAALTAIKVSSRQPTYISVPVSWSVYERFRRENFDLIHVHTSTTVNLLAWQMSSVLDLPIVYTYHTMTVEYAHYLGKFVSKFSSVVEPAIELFDRIVCNGADAIVAPSHKAQEYLGHIGVRPKVTVIPNGINLSIFTPGESRYLQERLGLRAEQPVLIFVGRLNEEKRPELVYALFRRILRDCPEAVLVFVGEGTLHEELESSIAQDGLQDCVYLLGSIAYADMPRVYQSADLWVSSSMSEVHPMVALEATACGLVAVAMHDPALDGVILHEQTGFLAETEEEFVTAAVSLLQDEGKRQRMAEAGARHALEFSVDVTAQRMAELYHVVLQENRQPREEYNLFAEEEVSVTEPVVAHTADHNAETLASKHSEHVHWLS